MEKALEKGLLGILASLALGTANTGANVACWGLFYQPEMPEELKK